VRVDAGAATDIGKVRERNEDSFLAEPPLFAVADGIGGHRGGEVASQLALEVLEQMTTEGKGTLSERVRQANRAVFERSQADKQVTGMGTTLTAVIVEGAGVRLAHVGDSRAYLLRAGSLRQLTDDHTLVARMVKTGEITTDEAEVHPHRNVLTRALGTESEVRVDEKEVPLIDGDMLLLCSDGLTGMVTEDQIQAILEASASPQDASDRLIKAANRAGGVDNITVVVLEAHEEAAVDPQTGASTAAARVPVPSGRTVRRSLIWMAVVVVVVAAGLFTGRAYLDGQWYVGVAENHVAVYRGIPATALGLHLSHAVFVSDLPAGGAAALPLYVNISDGLSAKDRDDAFAIVDQIRRDMATTKAAGATQGASP
jgi:PPM family protein phosphatase